MVGAAYTAAVASSFCPRLDGAAYAAWRSACDTGVPRSPMLCEAHPHYRGDLDGEATDEFDASQHDGSALDHIEAEVEGRFRRSITSALS
jgi:hypothetical protein